MERSEQIILEKDASPARFPLAGIAKIDLLKKQFPQCLGLSASPKSKLRNLLAEALALK
jgi:hypothetical protein